MAPCRFRTNITIVVKLIYFFLTSALVCSLAAAAPTFDCALIKCPVPTSRKTRDGFQIERSVCMGNGAPCDRCFVGPEWEKRLAPYRTPSGSRKLKPILILNDWLSAQITDQLSYFLLTEVLGFEVETVFLSPSDAEFECCPELPLVEWERWPHTRSKSDDIVRKAIGYQGKSGLYVASKFLDIPENSGATWYQNYIDNPALAHRLLPRSGFTNMSMKIYNQTSQKTWCELNEWVPKNAEKLCQNGSFVPPQCAVNISACGEVIMSEPRYDRGRFESLIINRKLPMIAVYVGQSITAYVRELTAKNIPVVFYQYEPHPLVQELRARSISFPSHNEECEEAYRENPYESGFDCNYPTTVLSKVVRKEFISNPDADSAFSHFFKSLELMEDDINQMLTNHEMAGSDGTVWNVSCDWLRTHFDVWEPWIEKPSVHQNEPQIGLIIAITSGVVCIVITLVVGALCFLGCIGPWGHSVKGDTVQSTRQLYGGDVPFAVVCCVIPHEASLAKHFSQIFNSLFAEYRNELRSTANKYGAATAQSPGGFTYVACPTAQSAFKFAVELEQRLANTTCVGDDQLAQIEQFLHRLKAHDGSWSTKCNTDEFSSVSSGLCAPAEMKDEPPLVLNPLSVADENSILSEKVAARSPWRGIQVAIGIHYAVGHWISSESGLDFDGPAVNVANTIARLAHGGQIISSGTCSDQCIKEIISTFRTGQVSNSEVLPNNDEIKRIEEHFVKHIGAKLNWIDCGMRKGPRSRQTSPQISFQSQQEQPTVISDLVLTRMTPVGENTMDTFELFQLVPNGITSTRAFPTLANHLETEIRSKVMALQKFNYEMIELVGEGKFGTVFSAVDRVIGSKVAVKIVHDQQQMSRLLAEIEILHQLNHQHVVRYIRSSAEEGQPVSIYMELCEGGALHDHPIMKGAVNARSAAEATLRLQQVTSIIHQLLLGLQHCHERGVWHRDVKPQNCLLTPEGLVKLSDFGVAHRVIKSSDKPSGMVGTYMYMAPEVVMCGYHNEKCDIFSIGILAAELLGLLPDAYVTASRNAALREYYGSADRENALQREINSKCDVCISSIKSNDLSTSGTDMSDSAFAPCLSKQSQQKNRTTTPQCEAMRSIFRWALDLWKDFFAMALAADPEKRASAGEILAQSSLFSVSRHPDTTCVAVDATATRQRMERRLKKIHLSPAAKDYMKQFNITCPD